MHDLTRVKGLPRSQRDPVRFRRLLKRMQKTLAQDGRFKGMSRSEILAVLRRTREEVWAETKDAAGTRR
jgi:hypothetical protein